MRILVADDDPTSQLVLKTALTRRGHDVACVGDGLEALRILQGPNPPPLVILDWMMPGLDGPDVCRKIRESAQLQYVYIILLTSKKGKQDLILGIDSGADVFLSKPVELDELKSRIDAAERILSFRPTRLEPAQDARPTIVSATNAETPLIEHQEVPLELMPKTPEISYDPLLVGSPRVVQHGRPLPTLGKVLLLQRIGQGGMGVVYRGYNPRTKTQVAVKVVSTALFRDDMSTAERFYREAQIASQIHSPYLVRVFDIDQEGSLLYLVMEYIDGVAATSCLIREIQNGKIGLDEVSALELCLAAARGLAKAHDSGIVHRDIKPENILVPYTADHQGLIFSGAKLTDLGVAKHELQGEGLTASNMTLGTIGFMAPEQIHDARKAGKPADIFGFGATLYLLLCGRLPFVADSPYDIFVETISRPHPPVAKFRPDVSSITATIVDTCLQKKPALRYPDASALVEDLEFALKQVQIIRN